MGVWPADFISDQGLLWGFSLSDHLDAAKDQGGLEFFHSPHGALLSAQSFKSLHYLVGVNGLAQNI